MMNFRKLLALSLLSAMSLGGLTLVGCGGEEAASTEAAARRVEIEVNDEGYQPGSIETQAGQPLTLAFRRTTESTCGAEVVFPGRDIRRELPLNETVEISITPSESGRIAFACGMNMLHGTIVVQ